MERVRATPKYESIADRIAWQIDRGVFEPGERLPSIRELSDQLAVSLNTIRESYRLLESRGLVEAVSQSGHYVRQGPPVCLDPLLDDAAIDGRAVIDVGESEWIDRVQRDAAQEGVIYLSTAEPPVSLLPARSIARALSRVVRDRPDRTLRYGPSEGPLELRQEIAKRMFRAGMDVAAALAREAVARWFPPGTTATRPEGGLVFWVALPARFDTRRVYERALREGIVFAPGPIFTLSDGYASHLRMSAVRFDAEVERAIRRLGELLQEEA